MVWQKPLLRLGHEKQGLIVQCEDINFFNVAVTNEVQWSFNDRDSFDFKKVLKN